MTDSNSIHLTTNVAHIYNGILLSHKKKRNGVICSEVDGVRVCQTCILYTGTFPLRPEHFEACVLHVAGAQEIALE